jgi:hypothetical protein
MHLFELIGYCPIGNDNSSASSYMQDMGIKIDYLGYELLANIDQLPGSDAIAELSHELLIRFGLLNSKESQPEHYLEELIDCIDGYITRSININKDQERKLDSKYFFALIGNNNKVNLNLNQIIKYYEACSIYKNESSFGATMLYRKIEFSVYMLIIATQTAILDSFGISNQEHLSFLSLPCGQTDKRIIFAKCFGPLKYKVDYGQSWIGKPDVNYDKWLTERVIPTDLVRAPYPQDSSTIVSIKNFKETLTEALELLKDPQNLIENTKSIISSNKNVDLKKSFVGIMCLVLIWKDGLAYFAWVPIFGDLFSMLGNSGLSRFVGVFGLLYLSQEIEFKFSTKMLFQKENMWITLVLVGILIGTIFTI